MKCIHPSISALLGGNYVWCGKLIFSSNATGEDSISLNGTDGISTGEIVIRREESFSFSEEND